MENWRLIKGFSGRYSVSDLGQVWSHRVDRVMKQYTDEDGYLRIGLRKPGGRSEVFGVHQLVARAFIRNKHAYDVLGRKPNVSGCLEVWVFPPSGGMRRYPCAREAAKALGVGRTAVHNALTKGSPCQGHGVRYAG